MAMIREEAEKIASRYIGNSVFFKQHGLGDGKDGCVFSSPRATAVKVFSYPEVFNAEFAVYQRLSEMKVTSVLGFAIPMMVNADKDMLVIEMTMVQPPFLLDFASAFLDEWPDFGDDVMEERWATWSEVFGDRIQIVRDVFYELEVKYGILYGDFTLNNLKFEN